jgi:general secretion pathway protein B
MSFILDALRKSEHQRHRDTGPGLVEVPIARRASRLPLLLAGLGALLLINLIVVGIVLLRRDRAPEAVSATPSAVAAPTPAAATPPPVTTIAGAIPVDPTQSREVRPLNEEATTYDEAGNPIDPATAAAPDAGLDESEETPPSQLQPPPPRPRDRTLSAAAGTTPPAVSAAGGVPTINDLTAQATSGLPVLNVDLHVYSRDPAQRFVVINGKRYQEGSALKEGPTVERITEDGVVLNHRGLRFLLPHQ